MKVTKKSKPLPRSIEKFRQYFNIKNAKDLDRTRKLTNKDKVLIDKAILEGYEAKVLDYSCPICGETIISISSKRRSDIKGAYCNCGSWVGASWRLPKNPYVWEQIVEEHHLQPTTKRQLCT